MLQKGRPLPVIFPAMMFALGFLCAFLLAMLILPPFIRKAARKASLTGPRKQRLSPKQNHAGRDRMRAEYAIAIRKQEQAAEMLRARGQQQLIEIAECNAVIRDMKREMSDITDLADRRYQQKQQLRSQLDKVSRANIPQPVTEPGEPAAPGKDAQISEGPTAQNSDKPRLPGTKQHSGSDAKSSDAKSSGTGRSRGLAGRIRQLKKNA